MQGFFCSKCKLRYYFVEELFLLTQEKPLNKFQSPYSKRHAKFLILGKFISERAI